MSLVVLDTDVASATLFGRLPDRLRARLSGHTMAITFVTLGELAVRAATSGRTGICLRSPRRAHSFVAQPRARLYRLRDMLAHDRLPDIDEDEVWRMTTIRPRRCHSRFLTHVRRVRHQRGRRL